MKIKRILGLSMVLVLTVCLLAGCGGKDRILYKEAKLDKIVELPEYKGIKVDTKSEEFKEMYEQVIASDIENNGFYTTEKVTEGVIAEGDTANIDYVGKKDGVAFEGGTAQGYDLAIGSGTFIPGFEEGLVGKKVGETVDLNITFPEEYQSEELAGQPVVFTVKINHIQKRNDKAPKEYYKDLGYKSVGEYEKATRKTAAESLIYKKIMDKVEIKEYPQEDIDIIYNATKKQYETMIKQQGADFETYLAQMGMTEADFKKRLVTEEIKPSMESQMVFYAILDKENLEFTQADIDKKAKEAANEVSASQGTSVTADYIKEMYGVHYLENVVVMGKVMDFLYENAKIK
ncbi:MAG: FKBP-type peptidyl-prolyl cis-trans isomerase [Clostridia bacterium]|nr:FKBP-type peptidyl-prolyl cis-trans isomerase [Clostridia bacterium]